ncbi:MAG: hypothetical protein Q8P67_10920 [archaeon]|nr:hypothetical protein [archaeon]
MVRVWGGNCKYIEFAVAQSCGVTPAGGHWQSCSSSRIQGGKVFISFDVGASTCADTIGTSQIHFFPI